MFSPETIIAFRQRTQNLRGDSPYSSMKALAVSLLAILKQESLESSCVVETAEQRDARRIAINTATENLMNLLTDPSQLYAEYLERKQREQEFTK
jgi:hypothetical protein